ncbi:NAD-dependent epimerase/dehydratase family protein [Xylanibacillus composti]|uniref:Epimerase n=1 Tax=Xylanibacillus composti TaxID=1572762 RepID=A0A8J4H5W0_9BACL|nr:NAD-dependent epimerase/dehydratase family protein [Xylanibacillus composti]MDT9724569.1 NAD-dependent epimerase/dehydratase family protein [Xylanibacillus composti]GIQ70271.1 epimerase [Xylanibacillus composti]
MHVVFGTGALGLAVMRSLIRKGKPVRMINRRSAVQLPERVELLQGNAEEEAFCIEACRGAEVVYNCTGLPYSQWAVQLPRIMQGIIAGAAAAGAKLIYGDNLYAYGPHAGGRYHEELPIKPVGTKTKVRAKMAEELLQAHRDGVVRAAIGRGSDFYGPGVTLSLLGERVFQAALQGKPAEIIGSIDLPHTHIYIDDFASGLVVLGEEEKALGQIWHIPSADTVTTRELLEMIYEQAGHKPRYRIANGKLLHVMGWFVPAMREFREIMYMLNEPFQADCSKFAAAFPVRTTPHRIAIQQTLAWIRSRS